MAVVSNQGGISLKPDPKTIKSDQKRLADFKTKVSSVMAQLDIPLSLYAATAKDGYRKPRTGMWQELLEDYDLDADSIDLEKSFFVGDAGGRGAIARGAPSDHSCADRFGEFAMQIYLLRILRNVQRLRGKCGHHVPYPRGVLSGGATKAVCKKV